MKCYEKMDAFSGRMFQVPLDGDWFLRGHRVLVRLILKVPAIRTSTTMLPCLTLNPRKKTL